ncbi:hypothetical protein SOM22_08505 [Stenotrophomonas rhizophila]|uniref:hypothetical protein n=1 Tax=Stenotrophomonas rhizophila TaxID=216778 RepID=UPI002A69ABFF|nr:hypothetical protein [Stenotrophomonas rhizophila]MDY0954615.1 hypothetical protein [Stenotrophomonas rhizophila]
MPQIPLDSPQHAFLSQFFDSLGRAADNGSSIAAELSAKNRWDFTKRDPNVMALQHKEIVSTVGANEASRAVYKEAVLGGIQNRERLGAQDPRLRDAAIELGVPDWAIPVHINI